MIDEIAVYTGSRRKRGGMLDSMALVHMMLDEMLDSRPPYVVRGSQGMQGAAGGSQAEHVLRLAEMCDDGQLELAGEEQQGRAGRWMGHGRCAVNAVPALGQAEKSV